MNFYKRHLGDIAKSCSDLSQGQMGAYDLLLDWHYANEKPIPLSEDKVHLIGRARTKAERDNVDSVLAELFTKTPAGYIHKRAGEEMAKAAAQAETNRAIAVEREATKRARTEHESCTNRQPSHKPDSTSQEANAPTEHLQADACPHQEILALYHELLPANPRIKVWNGSRAANLRSRWREDPRRQSLDYWRRYFTHVAASGFLTGRAVGKDAKPFLPGLDWLVMPNNFAKVIEGKYHDAR